MNGIVSAGDRALGAARKLRPLPPYPPREVPAFALWSGSVRDTPALPLALSLTVAGLLYGAVAIVFAPGPRGMPTWLPIGCLFLALPAWIVAIIRVRRARRLLESGMPVKARITRVHMNVMLHSNGRARTTIEYDWTFAGQSGHVRAHGFLGRGDRGLVVGDELDLVCDPSAPADHLIPLFFGFRLEGFPSPR